MHLRHVLAIAAAAIVPVSAQTSMEIVTVYGENSVVALNDIAGIVFSADAMVVKGTGGLAGTSVPVPLDNVRKIVFNDKAPSPVIDGRPGPAAQHPRHQLRITSIGGMYTIAFPAPEEAGAVVRIFYPDGRLARTLTGRASGPAENTVVWDGRDGRGAALPRGMYYTSVEAGGKALAGHIILVK
jgi:hypothetical protein